MTENRRHIAVTALLLGFVILSALLPSSVQAGHLGSAVFVNDTSTVGDSWHISAVGQNTNPGTAPDKPVRTIQKALSIAQADSDIYIGAGIFGETLSISSDNIRVAGSGETGTIGPSDDTGTILRGNGGSDSGIRVNGSQGLRLESIRVQDFGSHGFGAVGGSNNRYRRLKFLNNGGKGMLFRNSSGSVINDAVIEGQVGVGLEFDGSTSMLAQNLTVRNNGDHGVNLINQSNQNIFKRNLVKNNTTHGFNINNSDTPVLRLNTSQSNGSKGYLFDSSDSVTMIQNTAKNNTDQELHLQGTGSVNQIYKTNFLTGATNDVLNQLGKTIAIPRSYWQATDSTTVNAKIDFGNGNKIRYIPYRFDQIDTDPAADTVAPLEPRGVEADTSQPRKIILTWNQVSNNEEPAPSFDKGHYRIYRSATAGISTWKSNQIAQIAPSDTRYVDTDVNVGESYFYRLTTVDTPTSGDAQTFENESYLSKEIDGTPLKFGPSIYVNDTSTIGDRFTTEVGNDSNVGTKNKPLRTLSRAMDASSDGDSVFVDRGVFHDTAQMDTPNVTIVGASPDSTVLDNNQTDTFIRATASGLTLRNFTLRDNPAAVVFNGASDFKVINVSIRDNSTGITLKGGSTNGRITNNILSKNKGYGLRVKSGSNNYIAQNRFFENTGYQVVVDASPNSIERNNLYMDSTNPDSGARSSVSGANLNYNWWTTTDSTAIRAKTAGSGSVDYIPHRFGVVDTGVAGDSQAPQTPPSPTIDTSVAQEITISWNSPSVDEDSTPLTGFDGLRIYRIKNAFDTADWTQHLYRTLSPSDTSFTDTAIQKGKQYSYRITAFDTHTFENESYFTRVLSGTWVNRVPVADSLTVTTQRDSSVAFTLTASDADGDTLRFFIDGTVDGDSLTLPANGSLDRSNFTSTNPRLEYTPDSGFAGLDTFTFVVRDSDTVSDTAVVTLDVRIEHNTRLKSLGVASSDTPVFAGSGGTIPVRTVFENTKTGAGDVLRSADDISIYNALGRDVSDSFVVTLSGTDVRVEGNDTAAAEWGIQVPSARRSELTGNFQIEYITDDIDVQNVLTKELKTLGDSVPGPNRRTFNIAPGRLVADATAADSGIDTFSVTVQSIRLKGGLVNGSASLDGDSLADGDSVIRMIQRGGTETIDTPITNPKYRFRTADTFDIRINNAFDTLRTQDFPSQREDFDRNLSIVDDNLLLISLWRNAIFSGDYLGNSAQLLERSRVTVKNVDFRGDPERLSVVKLNPDDFSWTVVDKLNDVNDVTGSDGNYTLRFDVSPNSSVDGSGFSVFQIIATGVVNQGSADEAIAYPNPFVPYDGDPKTGEYGSGPNQGIYFGAGKNRGFPPGTEIEIYNVKGERIAQFNLNNGGILQWDARTGNGDPVASGVYVFRVETPDGEQKVGKFAVVR